ncbi:hypothetical protein [Streptomyces sp. NPDC054838]
MTAQAIHQHESERVPRNARGIAAALTAEAAKEFHSELLAATPEQAKGVLLRWWGQAMLDTDPDADARADAVLAGTVPTVSLDDLLARRRAAGLPVD